MSKLENKNDLAGLKDELLMSEGALRFKKTGALVGRSVLIAVASSSLMALLFIFYYIIRDALPFFQIEGIGEFLASTRWYPSREDAEFGALAIFIGSGLVTLGAIVVAVPMGVLAALCLSDILPFNLRQVAKPIIEMLAAIPSVVYGFFALIVFAPLLQERGGGLLAVGAWLVFAPIAVLASAVSSDVLSARFEGRRKIVMRLAIGLAVGSLFAVLLLRVNGFLAALSIASGTNALNASIILGIMALPTIVSVSEDALAAVGRELREGSYALGATRAETLLKVVVPAAKSGILAAVILGVMRAIGETMVVWMASGNAAKIPSPWFDYLEPIRTLTATIAGDMGEADHVTGSARYHVLFAMAFFLLLFAFAMNFVSELIVRRARKRSGAM
jgi:phosphate transport system permease protein